MIKKICRKLKKILQDFNSMILKGNRQDRINFIKKYKNHLMKLRNRLNNKRNAEQKRQFEKQMKDYLDTIKTHPSKQFILMFSGTTFIQEKRGNRPIRLTNAWSKAGIPVLFSYYRWNSLDDIPVHSPEHVFQMPIDYTMQYLDQLIYYDYGDKEKVFVVSFPYPELARYIGILKMNNWKVIYDVRDNWEEFHKVNMAKWYDEAMEKYFVCNCDIVCAVAKPLQAKMQQYTTQNQVRLSPNALDSNFYIERQEKNTDEDKEVLKVAYVGHLSAGWFNWEAIIEMATIKPKWIFEIVGHFEPNGLKLPENVRILGSKSHEEIRHLAKGWDVAMIPFKMGELSDCVDPIKIYEYLAMGLPVVSFKMPQIHDYPNTYIAYSNEEFIEKIMEAAKTPFNHKTNESFLVANTWEVRAQQLLKWTSEEER